MYHSARVLHARQNDSQVVNVVSCYWSIFKYARYLARRHPKAAEDENAVEVVLNLGERGREGTPTET